MTKPANPFLYFNSSPEVIRLVVMMYVKYPLSLRNVEDLLHERGIDLSYETVRYWWNRFGPMFAAEIRRKRVDYMRGQRHWKWHLTGGRVVLPLALKPSWWNVVRAEMASPQRGQVFTSRSARLLSCEPQAFDGVCLSLREMHAAGVSPI
jgi:hypothetical protein